MVQTMKYFIYFYIAVFILANHIITFLINQQSIKNLVIATKQPFKDIKVKQYWTPNMYGLYVHVGFLSITMLGHLWWCMAQ